MIIGKPAPCVSAFVAAVDEAIRAHQPRGGMSAMQRTWLAFCVTAVLVTNSMCWARFARASLGTYSLAALEYRYAAYQWDRLPALAAELAQRKPEVLVISTTRAVLAAKQATTTIPIVVAVAGDLVDLGIVASLARPGGNITGQILRDHELAGKRLEMLKEAAPTITQVAILTDPTNPGSAQVPSAFEKEARALGVRLQRVDAGTPEAISDALATIVQSEANALMIQDSSMFNAHRQHILDVARTHRLPTVCGVRVYAEAGCLIAYAPDILEMLRRAAVFVDKILKGTKPADIPMELPSKLELVLNLKTAESLGITFPQRLLVLADEVMK